MPFKHMILIALFDAEAFVSQRNFGYDYLTNTSNNIIPDMQAVDTAFS